MADQINPQADHDLLIKMNEKLDNITDWIAEKKQESTLHQLHCQEVQESCNVKFSDRVTQSLFRWAIGLMVLFLIGLGGIATSNLIAINVLQKQMETIVLPVVQQHTNLNGGDSG